MNRQGGNLSTDFFVYNAVFAPTGGLVAGASLSQQIQIEADSQFEWVKATWSCNVSGQTTTNQVSNILVQLQDGGTTLSLYSQPLPAYLVFGSGSLPLVLPVPRIFRANSSITVSITNFDPAATYTNIYFNFIGNKLYGYKD